MEIASNFDAKLLTSIAKDSESKQAVKDVSYASIRMIVLSSELFAKNISVSSVWLHAPATSIKGLRKNF